MAVSTHSSNDAHAGGGGLLTPGATAGWQSLGPVLAAADELASYADTDQMLRRAVEVTRENIGLERAGLFLRDPRAERVILRGTWGTGASRQTTDEHAVHHECGPEDAAQRVSGSALHFCYLVTQRRPRSCVCQTCTGST